jgi:hypothetical protein
VSDRSFDHATEAFEFIERLDDLATPQDIVDAMEGSFALFGFENFIITGLPNPKERFGLRGASLVRSGRLVADSRPGAPCRCLTGTVPWLPSPRRRRQNASPEP